ncbi:hypothetical protein [Pengzhenrongella sicca]|uniref:Serine/arginine repetitive matrix protein 2 n=1 Tax=Pengzhenrongella sicca TaxID=2819238 RepID=A0A8A4Z9T8_9MICO|nr:hypothetical protein [Pengzhenrongella sicca]QTE28614.1 hypothetical protein J4E96_14790 [Pengzhenrongella sicca]
MSTPTFSTPEGLRALLRRFADPTDPASWDGPDGAALARFCIARFERMARKFRQPREDAASFAFEVMCDPHLLQADDPWAVVTTAVRRDLSAQLMGESLLCGDRTARHGVDVHDPQRITDRDWTFLEVHLAGPDTGDDGQHPRQTKAGDIAPVELQAAVDDAVRLFGSLGWPRGAARFALEYIGSRLELAGNPATAFEYLRRDKVARARLDIDQAAWTAVLTAVLGSPHPDRALVPAGRGMLLRMLAGCPVDEVLTDPALTSALASSVPRDKAVRQ